MTPAEAAIRVGCGRSGRAAVRAMIVTANNCSGENVPLQLAA
jgi:hypothetical protein